MATRMYMWFDNTVPTVTIAKSGIWETEVTNAIRQPLRAALPAATNSTGLWIFSGAETSAVVNDVFCGQFISIPMKAQNLTGTVHGIWSGRQAASDYGLATQMIIRVFSNDGSVNRGILFDAFNYNTTVTTAGANNRSFATGTTRTTRFLPGGTGNLNSMWCYNGDRLVVEIGVRATNTTATSRAIDPRLQLRPDFSDGALSEEVSGSTFNHWIEFSQDLTFDAGFSTAAVSGWGTLIKNTATPVSDGGIYHELYTEEY